jgi:hypothetical protein
MESPQVPSNGRLSWWSRRRKDRGVVGALYYLLKDNRGGTSIIKLTIATSNDMSIMSYALVPVVAVLSLVGYLVWPYCVGRKSGVRYLKLTFIRDKTNT